MNITQPCRAISIGQMHIRKALQDIGISTLVIESDMSDPCNWSDARIKLQVEAFLESI